MSKLILLKTWARETYGEDAPSNVTLLRWVKKRKILPLPQKQGRAYYVSPEARYTEPSKPRQLVDRLAREEEAHAS